MLILNAQKRVVKTKMERRDYIMDQIDKTIQFIGALMRVSKTEHSTEASIEQSLSALTGLDASLFLENNANLLNSLLEMLPDDNQKVLVAQLLLIKNAQVYKKTHERLMAKIDLQSLNPKIRTILSDWRVEQ